MGNILYLTVRVKVNTEFTNISETLYELEHDSIVVIADTPNVQVVEAEIMKTRFRKPKK